MSDIEDRIKKVMVKLFKVSHEEINDESSLHNIIEWSSIKHLELIIKLEKEFEINFDQDEIPSMINFKVICSTIESYI
tara:strand:+ start:103 stop:336 length:234 start_codon:yes stop_codon:yes gene_type:complete